MRCPNPDCGLDVEVAESVTGGHYVRAHDDRAGGVCSGSWMPAKGR